MSSALKKYFSSLSLRRPPRTTAPALWVASAFALGIYVAEKISLASGEFYLLVLCALILIVLASGASKRWRNAAVLLVFALLGAARFHTAMSVPQNHWTKLKGILSVRVIVCGFPEYRSGRWRAFAKVVSANCGDGFIPSRGKVMLFITDPEEQLAYGQLWEIASSPREFPDEGNFFTCDYSDFFRRQGVDGFIWSDGHNAHILDEDRGSPIIREVIAGIRRHISDVISASLPGEEGALLEGMILGGGRKLTRETKTLFSNAGVIHILAVSGLHVGIIASVLWFVFRRMMKLKMQYVAALTVLILAMYALLVQLRPAVLRATIMASFVLLAPILRRRSNVLNSIGAAGLAILIARPNDFFTAGFRLSFAATLGIVYLLPRMAALFGENFLLRRGPLAIAWQFFLVTICVLLGVAPISAYYFHKVQLLAPIANMIIVPLVSIATSLGSIGILTAAVWKTLGVLFIKADKFFLCFILFVAKNIGKLPLSFIPLNPDYLPAICYYASLLGFANSIWSKRARFFAAVGALAVLAPWFFHENACEVIFANARGNVVYFADESGKSALFVDCDERCRNIVVFPLLTWKGRRSADVVCLPVTRRNIENRDVLQGLGGRTLAPAQFPDSLTGGDWVRDSVSVGEISASFISPKNCIVSVRKAKLLILLAPIEEVPEASVLYINFPADFVDESDLDSYVDAARKSDEVILGGDARGWGRVLSEMGASFYALRMGALRLTVDTQSQLIVIHKNNSY